MGSKSVASIILLSLNLFFFSMVSSQTAAPPAQGEECPELGLCLNILGGNIIGSPSDCCPLLDGLADIDAVVCICDQLRSRILGLPINLDINLIAIFNACGRNTTNLICN
ncbi:hydrophobic seed protein [Cajanus cajan]|uniref:14 kDa proline-rich protein DC2.15 n=1 Tax=Cajanus cajan TaxID=3821 RepID=A0A151UGK8_CAJCA|nr:hydrophobic seed protein [Cajanus cajan]XP_020209760.1 hydrophobic seed protein [Cajanus cajan]